MTSLLFRLRRRLEGWPELDALNEYATILIFNFLYSRAECLVVAAAPLAAIGINYSRAHGAPIYPTD